MGLPVVTTAELDNLYQQSPAPVFSALGQLTPYDRLLYSWSTREFYRKEGLVVDGGALVGGTTVVLAEGLLANRHLSAPGRGTGRDPHGEDPAHRRIAYFYLGMGRKEAGRFVARRLIDQFDVSPPFVERSDLKTLFAKLEMDYRSLHG